MEAEDEIKFPSILAGWGLETDFVSFRKKKKKKKECGISHFQNCDTKSIPDPNMKYGLNILMR